MYVEEEDYDNFKREEVNYLSDLRYEFNLNQRFVNVRNDEGKNFRCQTPFLKVLKPIHVTLNKKKTIAKKYIILETNDDLDFNNQIGDFLFIVNKIHEISQEKIKENSLEWFNTEFDEIGLDIKVKRPIDQQKDSEFIRISLPKNKQIEDQINELKRGDYVLCNIIFKGLKVSNDYITEEWELEDFMTQEQYEHLKKTDLLYEDIEKTDRVTSILEEEYMEELNKEKYENNEKGEIIDEAKEEEINETKDDIIYEGKEETIEEGKEEVNNETKCEEKDNIINEDIEMSVVEVNYGECEQTKEIQNEIELEKNDIKDIRKNKEKKSVNEKILENKTKKKSLTSLTNLTNTSNVIKHVKKNKKLLYF